MYVALFLHAQAYYHFESSSNFLMSAGPWWTGAVHCAGDEADLRDCPHTPLGKVRSCNSTHSAGVLCYDNIGQSISQKNLEICWVKVGCGLKEIHVKTQIRRMIQQPESC